jgi:hypothetical protein
MLGGQVVLSRPWDDKEIVDVYFVSHDNISPKKFETHWDREIKKAKKAEPETWMISQVIDALRGKGWQIIRFDPIKVSY